jgi:malonyl-CoA/methylmalonyl-CoA synthetase
MNANLCVRLERVLARDLARPVIRWRGAWVSRGALLERAGRMAAHLRRLGVRPGDRVAAQVEKSLDAVALYLGTLRLGAIYLPLNTGYTTAELAYFLSDAEPRVAVCDPAAAVGLEPLASRCGATLATLGTDGRGSLAEAADAAEPIADAAETDADAIAAILYTSGTTGRSKGAMLSHGNLWSNTEALLQAWEYTEDDVLIHALPLFHTHGLFVALNMTLAAGARLHLLERFDPDEAIRLMAESTVLMGVPTFYGRLLAHPGLTREATASMRLFVSGSAPLLAETHRAFAERTGHAILERYGMTETGMNISNPLDGERRPGSVGLPLPRVEARVTDDEGRPLPPGAVGNIEIKGPNVFKGYWRMPEKTASEFRPDGFFVTGDLGSVGEGGYFTVVGRTKDLVISGGYNVYPKEVEDLLNALPEIAESAVIGAPHPDLGEGVVALVVPAPEADAQRASQAAEAAAREALAGYKRPKRVIVCDALPRNTMGKVQKNLLRDAHRTLFEKDAGR